MPLDPLLVAGFRPTPNLGPDMGKMLQNAGAMWDIDAQRKQAQTANALKGILSAPGAIDANGNPTAEALGRVTAVSPELGIKFRQNALKTQQDQLRFESLKSDVFGKKLDLQNEAYAPILETYEDAIKAGKPEQQAREEAQAALTDANKRLTSGGMFSTEEQGRFYTQFDPVKFHSGLDGSEQIQKWRAQQIAAEREKRQEGKDLREEAHQEFGDQTPTEISYTGKDGKKVITQGIWDRQKLQWVDANTHQILEGDVQKYKPPAVGSVAEQREAINQELAEDPEWKSKPAGDRAREAETRLAVASGRLATPEGRHSMAEAIAGYQIAPLSGYAMTRPGGPETMQEVLKINPGYSAPRFNEVNRVMTAFGTGKQGDIVRALNTATQHLDVMEQAGKALKNGDMTLFNRLGNRINAELGYAAPTEYDGLKQIVGTEIEKAVAGGIGAEADRERLMRALSGANSPEQMQAIFDGFKSLMTGQVNSLKIQYEDGTGFTSKSPFAFEKKLTPEAAGLLTDLNAGKTAKSDQGGAKTNPANPANPASSAQAAPPDEAIKLLQQNAKDPKYIASFNKHFGEGAAERALGGGGGADKPAAAKPAGTGRTFQDPISVTDPEQARKLPPGTYFLAPDGKIRQRPMAQPPSAPTD